MTHRHGMQRYRPGLAVAAGIATLLAAGCGGAPATPMTGDPSADAGPDVADPPPDFPLTRVPGRSVARLSVTPARVVLLEETLAGFDQDAPGRRRVRTIDRRDLGERSWEPPAPVRIADAAVHPSGAITVALVDAERRISIVRLDGELAVVRSGLLVDPLAATDPPADPTAGPDLLSNGFTAESVRLGALGEDAVVAVFTSRNSVIAYRLARAGAGFSVAWRSLLEPSVGVTPFLPIGGSFDTFGAIVARFRPSLAIDPLGNAYVAVWAGPSRIKAHDLVLGDELAPLTSGPPGDSDVIVTKIAADGRRLWSRVVGTPNEDEPYALAAARDQVVIAGRSRRNPGFDNSQWDPWLAALDGGGGALGSRALPFAALGIVLAVAVDGSGAVLAGGSDGWTQNPEGLSIFTFGSKLLFTLAGTRGEPARRQLDPGPRHNEIRSVVLTPEGLWYAGHEDGPLTHSGDGDPGQIRATGIVGFVPVGPAL